jgi:hypothetical protein
MSIIKTAAEIFRRYVTAGVPASGPNPVNKDDVIGWGTWLESMLSAGQAGLAYATLANLAADLAHGANSTAVVYNDVAANNGLYVKSGASGSGSWSRIGDLPLAIIPVTVTGGSANAIVGTGPESPLLPGSKLFLLTPTANNTNATTLAYNGAAALPIVSAFGTALVGGELLNASPILMLGASDHFTLLLSTNVDASGILASAVAAASSASSSATAAATSATTAQGYALTASPITRPAYGPVASPWPYFIGDSLFTNAHVTTALPTLIKNHYGWGGVAADAVSGASIADQASIYGWQHTPSILNPAAVWLGTNDVILDSSNNRTTETTSLEGLRALLCRLAIPTTKRVTGQAMTVASGTWTNMGGSLDPGGTTCATNGAVKRATVTGRHIAVAGWANLSSNGLASIIIGNSDNSGPLLTDILTFKRPVILTNSPGGVATTVVPFVRIYKNVGIDDTSKSTVSVAVASATGAGNDVFISYVAGLSGLQDEAMPLVACANLHHFTAAGETAQGTSGTRRERFNRGIANIVSELVGLGLWIVAVDVASVLWDTTLLGGDGVHPTDTGNTALTTEFDAAFDNAQSYYKKRLSQFTARGIVDTYGSDLVARGRYVISDFRPQVKSRENVGSGFSAHNNGSNQTVANNSPVSLTWSTEQYDVNNDFASNTWSPAAGPVAIRAAATFTAGVDQAIYELYVYKNGSSFKRLARVTASGVVEFQIGGEAWDIAVDGDAYTIVAFQLSGGSVTVDGTSSKTYFMGASHW